MPTKRFRLGASALPLYTALVYRGSGLVSQSNCKLSRLLDRDGVRNLSEAVGVDA